MSIDLALARIHKMPGQNYAELARKSQSLTDVQNAVRKAIGAEEQNLWGDTCRLTREVARPVHLAAQGNPERHLLVHDAVNNRITQELSAAGMLLDAKSVGVFSKYISDTLRFLKGDIEGEFFAVDANGDPVYAGRSAFNERSKKREEDKAEAEAAERAAKLKSDPKMLGLVAGQKEEAKKPASAPAPEGQTTAPPGEEIERLETGDDDFDKAMIEVVEALKLHHQVDKADAIQRCNSIVKGINAHLNGALAKKFRQFKAEAVSAAA